MKVRKLLANESKWIKGCEAVDVTAKPVVPEDRSAVQWCLYGAVLKCYGYNCSKILKLIYPHINDVGIARWNDAPERTFAEVRTLVEALDI